MTAALHDDATTLTGGVLSRARRRADAAYAQFHLDVADTIHMIHNSPHPDLDELDRVGITITGKGADRWYGALDLVANEYAHDEHLTLDDAHAKIHDSWRTGHDSRVLWTAVADATVEAEKNAGLTDPRSHGERATDAAVDLIRRAMNHPVPAHSDATTPATNDSPTPTGRTHKPATSVQIICRGDASTFLGLTDEQAWIDGYGPVPAHVARELATTTGAMWREGLRRHRRHAPLHHHPRPDLRRPRLPGARHRLRLRPRHRLAGREDHRAQPPRHCRGHHRIKTQYVWESTRDQRARLAARNPEPPPVPDDDPPPF